MGDRVPQNDNQLGKKGHMEGDNEIVLKTRRSKSCVAVKRREIFMISKYWNSMNWIFVKVIINYICYGAADFCKQQPNVARFKVVSLKLQISRRQPIEKTVKIQKRNNYKQKNFEKHQNKINCVHLYRNYMFIFNCTKIVPSFVFK